MSDLITSLIRTVVPVIVGSIGAFLASKNIEVSESDLAALTTVLTAGITSVYYLTARFLETKYPKAGYLLGSPKQPIYDDEVQL